MQPILTSDAFPQVHKSVQPINLWVTATLIASAYSRIT